VEFEWDEAKARSNFRKHGVSFEIGATVFFDPSSIEMFSRRVDEEDRFVRIGKSSDGSILIIAYTWRTYEQKTRCRIISARKAGREERGRYASLS
jgi:uncharacterized DUF497 family protein